MPVPVFNTSLSSTLQIQSVVTQHSDHYILCAPEAPVKQKQTKCMPRSQSLGTGLSRGHFQGPFNPR